MKITSIAGFAAVALVASPSFAQMAEAIQPNGDSAAQWPKARRAGSTSLSANDWDTDHARERAHAMVDASRPVATHTGQRVRVTIQPARRSSVNSSASRQTRVR